MGGGNYLTENYPTYFHTFVKRKILTGSETPEGFKEVTAKEREKIEKSDAAWVRPPQAFIDMWNSACGAYGTFNEATGYFELNGLIDITYAEALRILAAYNGRANDFNVGATKYAAQAQCRTWIPSYIQGLSRLPNNLFDTVSHIEVLRLFRPQGQRIDLFVTGDDIFGRCNRIRKWLDVIWWFGNTALNNNNKFTFRFDSFHWYKDNHPFEYFRFGNVNFNIDCQCYENIGIDSFEYVVNNRYPLTTSGANPFTITVHPKVYAKLTEDADTEWTQLLAKAADKQITFATTE